MNDTLIYAAFSFETLTHSLTFTRCPHILADNVAKSIENNGADVLLQRYDDAMNTTWQMEGLEAWMQSVGLAAEDLPAVMDRIRSGAQGTDYRALLKRKPIYDNYTPEWRRVKDEHASRLLHKDYPMI